MVEKNAERVAAELRFRVGNHNPQLVYLTSGTGERTDGDILVATSFSSDVAQDIVRSSNTIIDLMGIIEIAEEVTASTPCKELFAILADIVAVYREEEMLGE